MSTLFKGLLNKIMFFKKKETVNEFLERSYVNFVRGLVFVFNDINMNGTPEIWSMTTADNYIKYLEGEL